MKNALIIPSGGTGTRFGSKVPKQYINLEGIPIIIRTLLRFNDLDFIDFIFIALDKEWESYVTEKSQANNITKEIIFVNSGKTRAESIKNCIKETDLYEIDYLFVHDAVRCNVSKKLIKSLYASADNNCILVPGLKSTDTIKIVKNNKIKKTLNRDEIFRIQTPQLIKKSAYKKILKKVDIFDNKYSDDASIFEEYYEDIKVIEGDPLNIKITDKFDYEFSKYILLNNLLD